MAAALAKHKEETFYTAATADKHVLYQESVQGVELEIDYVRDIFFESRKRKLLSIREDFCGTALSACEWVSRDPGHTAVAVDIDASVLDWGREYNIAALTASQQKQISLKQADVLAVKHDPVDVCLAFNFSYWIFNERRVLKSYFQKVYESLKQDGVFFLDTFGGYDAYKTQQERRDEDGFVYIWDQASFNPITNQMQCYIHFEFPDGSKMDKAFSYNWRLWSCAEVRDILAEVGFKNTRVFAQDFEEDGDEPLDTYSETEEMEDYATWIGYIIAEK